MPFNSLEIRSTRFSYSMFRTVVGLPCGHNASAAKVARNSQVVGEDNPSKQLDLWASYPSPACQWAAFPSEGEHASNLDTAISMAEILGTARP